MFNSISDQIISWANKSENEKDGRTLIQVIKLVFDKATEATWSEMYARLGIKMMEQISPKFKTMGSKTMKESPLPEDSYSTSICSIGVRKTSSTVGW